MTTAASEIVDVEALAVIAAGLADDAARLEEGWLARIGHSVIGVRDDGTVFAHKRFTSPEAAEEAWSFIVAEERDAG